MTEVDVERYFLCEVLLGQVRLSVPFCILFLE